MSIWDDYPITEILEAIKQLRQTISWKPRKASTHLLKRIRLGHLPSEATLEEYEAIIHTVLRNPKAQLYIFIYNTIIYPTVVAQVKNRLWLVMFSLNGVLETAFPPDNPKKYLANLAFIPIGFLEDLE